MTFEKCEWRSSTWHPFNRIFNIPSTRDDSTNMSFKISLFTDEGKLMPLANDNEIFILERSGISFSCNSSGHKFKGNGRIYITNQRLVFCADNGSTQNDMFFESFEIPLVHINHDKFNQPLFGPCNLSGDVISMLYDDPTSIKWKIAFNNGGTGTFLGVFLKLMEQKKDGMIDQGFLQKQQKAFVDPNDPSILYVSQPIRPKKELK